VQAVLERADGAEVAAAPAQRPEEVRVLVRVGPHQLAVGRHELGTEQVVGREPVRALEPAAAAAERQPGDAGRRDAPARGRQAEGLRGAVELAPAQARSGAHGAPGGVDLDPLHRRDVDHDAAVADREPDHAVTAAAHRQRQLALARVPDRRRDVGRRSAAGDDLGAAIDHRVEHSAGVLVARVAGHDRVAGESPAEAGVHGCGGESHLRPFVGWTPMVPGPGAAFVGESPYPAPDPATRSRTA
jgi:hypothetical protein